jgi:hypothetical protein
MKTQAFGLRFLIRPMTTSRLSSAYFPLVPSARSAASFSLYLMLIVRPSLAKPDEGHVCVRVLYTFFDYYFKTILCQQADMKTQAFGLRFHMFII